MVLIPATVVDRSGHFVGGLESSRFRVFDGKQQVPIRSFSMEAAPLSAVILLDASRSMRKGIQQARAGLRKFLRTSIPGDEFCLVTFAAAVNGPCEFTESGEDIESAAALAMPEGETAIVDALIFALHEVKRGVNARKAVIVLSDGVDTASRYKWAEANRVAQETEAVVYGVVPRAWDPDDAYEVACLEEVAETTGGALLQVRDSQKFPDAFDDLEIRRQYIIGFRPVAQERDGKYHPVKVVMGGKPEQGRLRVHWRRGYYSTAFHY